MKSKDRLDIFPFALLWCDAGSTLGRWVCDELVYDAEALSFIEGFSFEGFASLLWRGSRSNTVDPIANSVQESVVDVQEMSVLHTETCRLHQTNARRMQPSQRGGRNVSLHCVLLSAGQHWREPRRASRTGQQLWLCL